MQNQYKAKLTIVIAFASIILTLPSFSHAQTSNSTGRTSGSSETLNDNSYRTIQRIREHIEKGEFERAQSRSERIIRTEERQLSRTGMSESGLYKEAYNALCISLTNQGKLQEAFTACDKAIEVTPNHWESFKSRATLYYMVQDFQESLADFEKSLEHAPNNEEIADVLKQNIAVVQSKIN